MTGTYTDSCNDATIIDVVFGGNTGNGQLANAKAFASMVDDARQVLLFVHDNVEITRRSDQSVDASGSHP